MIKLVKSVPYSQQETDSLYNLLVGYAEKQSKRKYMVFIDNKPFISKTNDLSLFKLFERFITDKTYKISIKIFDRNAFHSKQYNFIVRPQSKVIKTDQNIDELFDRVPDVNFENMFNDFADNINSLYVNFNNNNELEFLSEHHPEINYNSALGLNQLLEIILERLDLCENQLDALAHDLQNKPEYVLKVFTDYIKTYLDDDIVENPVFKNIMEQNLALLKNGKAGMITLIKNIIK